MKRRIAPTLFRCRHAIEHGPEEGAAMTADEFAEELRALVGDAEDAGLELPALIAVLADQLDAIEEAMAE